jgi:hypothetical protein
MAKLSPIGNNAQFINGIPATGAKLFFYAAGSSTKQTTYADEAGLIPQTNPIILDSRGEPAQPIWLTEGLEYKVVFTASTDTDPPTSPIWDVDNVTGINDSSVSVGQWIDSGVTPTYVNATQFTLPGDQTTAFEVGRRIKATVTSGTVYGTITTSVFGALTTVTVFMDGVSTLDSGLSSVQYGIITPTNSSLPKINLRSGDAINESISTVASSATPDIWTGTSNNINYTGAIPATGFAAAPQAGTTRTLILAAAASFTAGVNMLIDGVVSFTGQAGDEVEVTAVTTTQFRVRPKRSDGKSIIGGDPASNAEYVTGTDNVKPLTAAVARARNIVQGTLVAASGTSVDITGIPSWAKRITVIFNGVSTSGTSPVQVQLGTSGGIQTTGYGSCAFRTNGSAITNTSSTTGLLSDFAISAGDARTGIVTICLITGNTWTSSGSLGAGALAQMGSGSGSVALGGVLDRLRITTIGGVDTFDAGSFNIFSE